MDIQKLIIEYEICLQKVRAKIERMKLQESAYHACGEHLAAYKLSQQRMKYEYIELDLLYALAEMAKTADKKRILKKHYDK